MVPTDEILTQSLQQTEVIILSGQSDPIVPSTHPGKLNEIFKHLKARTHLYILQTDHNLTQQDLDIIQKHVNS